MMLLKEDTATAVYFVENIERMKMSDHDPLCLSAEFACEDCQTNQCVCDLIHQARADERERIAQAIEAAAELHYAPSAIKRAARIARNND